MNVLNVVTLDIPEATLIPREQAFNQVSRSNILVYFCVSFYTFIYSYLRAMKQNA